ncbi:hypothetical protein GCM10022409_16900 [Hymenobacter glaciei]|uniref:Adhesin domain-containing protein n=2 Tax=Hymenobacter glaciei TaxID=877209 RepID=A0ABP7TYJ8_9BACT
MSLPLTFATLWLFSAPLRAQAQEATEKITKEFTVQGDASRQVLAVYNLFGSVAVEGYAGNKVLLEVTKTVTAPDDTLLEAGKKEVQLAFVQRNDSIIAYTTGPHDSRPNQDLHNHRSRWDHDSPRYRYTINYTVKVPTQLNLHVSTVNGGQVTIADVAGTLHAHNVNGSVSIKNARSATDARTVNGNVEVTYARNPGGPCTYHTINGQIIATYPPDLGANVHFKSFHGEMYTDFPKTERLAPQVSQNKQTDGNGTKYKISKETAVRLGNGGPDLRFETLNGDVTIKQQSK